MPKRQSLYDKVPDYKVDLNPSPQRVLVLFGGEAIADSTRTLEVCETNLPPVTYFPREDVRLDLLERTEHETFCPFKGEASYWSLRGDDRSEKNAVWSYEDPFDEVSGLKDYLAFYADKVEWERQSISDDELMRDREQTSE
jgi:uncharacterized protein (DUF427 family)